jgi:hypothetical protein
MNKSGEKGGVLQRIKDFFAVQEPIRELIGRATYVVGSFWQQIVAGKKSIDESRTDYTFWDRFRHGKAKGFEIAGVFAKPITQILASWVLGSRVTARVDSGDQYTNMLLSKFLRRIHGLLIKFLEDLYALGDMYIIVNPDGSLSMPSPETVDVEYDPLDYRRPIRFRVTTSLSKATVIDDYTAQGRTMVIKWAATEDRQAHEETRKFENLTGRIPVIHFANDRSGNEIFGRPVYEALFRVFGRYDDLVEKGLDGAELLGNPIPAFEGVEDIDETIEANADPNDAITDPVTGETHPVINWHRLQAIFVGKGGRFDYKSPRQNFTSDVREMLKLLFLLVLEFTRIPEAVWGGELTSSRSTAVEQMKNFYNHIRARRIALEGAGGDEELGAEPRGGLLELIDVWLRTVALTDRRVKVGDITMYWEPLTEVPYDVRLKATQWANGMGYISGRSALRHLEMIEYAISPEELEHGEDGITDPYERALQDDMDADGIATRRLQADDNSSNTDNSEQEQYRRRERLSA